MLNKSKQLMQDLGKVVSLSSISSTNPRIDTGNRAIVEFLANSFESLGFTCELIPTGGNPEKLNLIAT
jgi:acetylornithine deacetylase